MEIIASIDTPFGLVSITGDLRDVLLSITRIRLPGELGDTPVHAPAIQSRAARVMVEEFARQIRQYLSGTETEFSTDGFAMHAMSPFQRQVLLLCRQIPRGKVSTYGTLAARLHAPKAARAVGTALARNPFPLVIPCHRVVRSGGDVGNFGGGRPMKKALLQMEGIQFDANGKVLRDHFWY